MQENKKASLIVISMYQYKQRAVYTHTKWIKRAKSTTRTPEERRIARA
jgi:hypothetical protein